MSRRRTREWRARLEKASEEIVVLHARAGDDAAFTELVLRRQKRVRDLLRRLCGDHALADDLAQIVFVQAWQNLQTLRDPGAFGGWLKRVAVNVWLADVRRAVLPIEEDDEAVLALVEPGPSPERAAASVDLDDALAELNPDERLCVVLAHGEGMTHPEIAAIARMPLGTVKSHVSRGTAKLKRIIVRMDAND